jgi:hypothetical protein
VGCGGVLWGVLGAGLVLSLVPDSVSVLWGAVGCSGGLLGVCSAPVWSQPGRRIGVGAVRCELLWGLCSAPVWFPAWSACGVGCVGSGVGVGRHGADYGVWDGVSGVGSVEWGVWVLWDVARCAGCAL